MNSETVPVIKDEDEFEDICGGFHDDWELSQVNESFVKHDITNYNHLVKHKQSGKFYGISYCSSYNNGMEESFEFPWTPPEVEVKEIKRYTWKEKARASLVKTPVQK